MTLAPLEFFPNYGESLNYNTSQIDTVIQKFSEASKRYVPKPLFK